MTSPRRKKRSKRRIGRPNPADHVGTIAVRVADADREAWERCASASGLQLSQWVRYHLARAAGGTAAIVGVEFRTAYPPHDPNEPLPDPWVGTDLGKDNSIRDALEGIASAVVRLVHGDRTVGRQRAPVHTDLRGVVEAFCDKHADRVWAQELRADLDLLDRQPPQG